MSLRRRTCDGPWPSASACSLFRGRRLPTSRIPTVGSARQLKGLVRALMLTLHERIQGGVPVDHT
eukprot:835127-Alexandrium_andersonii.AAC.1